MTKKKLLLGFAVLLAATLLYPLLVPKPAQKLVSPWISSGGEAAINLWFPKVQANFDDQDAPNLTAKAAYFVEAESGQVLYQKNPHEKLPIASLTKIMTAIVTLENKKMTDPINISQAAAAMEPDHMLLIGGEKLTVKELLYGVFLVSANDAAEALAENVTSNRENFISLMNSEALQLGMKDSQFINPTGLQEDNREQYSTAFDVAIMSRYLIKHFPEVVEISSTPHMYLPQTSTHQDYDLYSGINLLTTYPGVLGLKTGYTPEAGLTLVTLAKKDNVVVLGVLLNSENRREEAREMLDYSFKKLGINP
jgi:serine-type D-Ala-D-Ala carboxypeptidase (penicillin-binding protein 5/6)